MREVNSGKVVLLIGTSSAGKTSIANCLQDICKEHYLNLGIDTFFHMVAPKWGGGYGGPLSYEGFRYKEYEENGEQLVRIVYGSVGAKVLAGMHKAVRAIAESGNNVIVDEMLLDKPIIEDWAKEIGHLELIIVKVVADFQILREREIDRGNRPGLAIGHFYDNDIDRYDILIDSSVKSPEQCAREITLHGSL